MQQSLKDYTSLEFFGKKVVPRIMTDANREFVKKVLDFWGRQRENFSKKASSITYNAYVEYLLRRVKEKPFTEAFEDTIFTLEKYLPEILSYVNDFEILKRFIYPPSKPFPIDEKMRFTILQVEKEIDDLMKRGIMLENFDLPYTFPLYGVWVFTEEELKEAEFLEEWRKEQILAEAKYLTQEFFYSESGEYGIPAAYLKYRGKRWFVVKYYFPENVYVPNFSANDHLSRLWQNHFKGRWLGSFRIDVYGKKPSTLDLNRPKDFEFLKALKEDVSSVILA